MVDLARKLGIQRLIASGSALPPIDPELRRVLSQHYLDEFDELEASLDVDLRSWRAKS